MQYTQICTKYMAWNKRFNAIMFFGEHKEWVTMPFFFHSRISFTSVERVLCTYVTLLSIFTDGGINFPAALRMVLKAL